MFPPALDLVDDSRRFVVQMRARASAALGPYTFDATGRSEVTGGGELRRFVEAMRPDIESIADLHDAQPCASPEPAPGAPDPRIVRARRMRADGRSWAQIGREMGLSGERVRQLVTRGG